MKSILNTLIVSLLCLSFSAIAESTIRLDTGIFKATDVPASPEGNGNQPIPSDAHFLHRYVRLAYSTSIFYDMTLSTYGEYLELQQNNFDQETSKDGDSQKGLSEVGAQLSKNVFNYSDWYSLGLGLGFSAPGYGYNANSFNAPGQGFTAYILSLENTFILGNWALGANITYKERPGSNGSVEAPEQLIYDLSASYFHKSHFISVSMVALRAQSGVNLSGQYFTKFPVVKEYSNTTLITYGYLFDSGDQIDINYSLKNAVKNTDGGFGVNIGYSYNF